MPIKSKTVNDKSAIQTSHIQYLDELICFTTACDAQILQAAISTLALQLYNDLPACTPNGPNISVQHLTKCGKELMQLDYFWTSAQHFLSRSWNIHAQLANLYGVLGFGQLVHLIVNLVLMLQTFIYLQRVLTN